MTTLDVVFFLDQDHLRANWLAAQGCGVVFTFECAARQNSERVEAEKNHFATLMRQYAHSGGLGGRVQCATNQIGQLCQVELELRDIDRCDTGSVRLTAVEGIHPTDTCFPWRCQHH